MQPAEVHQLVLLAAVLLASVVLRDHGWHLPLHSHIPDSGNCQIGSEHANTDISSTGCNMRVKSSRTLHVAAVWRVAIKSLDWLFVKVKKPYCARNSSQ